MVSAPTGSGNLIRRADGADFPYQGKMSRRDKRGRDHPPLRNWHLRRSTPSIPTLPLPGGKPADAPGPSPAPAEFPPKLYTEMPRAVEKRMEVKASANVSRPGAGNVPETPSAARGHPDKIGKKVMKFLQNSQFTPILRFCYTSVQAVDFGGGVWYDTYRGKGSYTGLNG